MSGLDDVLTALLMSFGGLAVVCAALLAALVLVERLIRAGGSATPAHRRAGGHRGLQLREVSTVQATRAACHRRVSR